MFNVKIGKGTGDLVGASEKGVAKMEKITKEQVEELGIEVAVLRAGENFRKTLPMVEMGESVWNDTTVDLVKSAFGVFVFCGGDVFNAKNLYEYCFQDNKRVEFTAQAFSELAKKRAEATTESEIAACNKNGELLESYIFYYENIFSKTNVKIQAAIKILLANVLKQ